MMLDNRFHGPYPIVEPIGTQTYCLKVLQQACSFHDVLHISLLDPLLSNRCTAPKLLLPIEIDGKEEYELEEIL